LLKTSFSKAGITHSKNSNLLSIGHSFVELQSVDSTNNYAMGKVHEGMASHGMMIFAHEQWAGKGQRGKAWTSTPGENIIVSTVLQPVNLPLIMQFPLSAAVALACHDLFGRYAGAEDTTIKWPNDLYWRDRKAGGILIENIFKGDQWAYAIIGTGININQTLFPDTARNPVSLKQITGRSFDAVALTHELGTYLEIRYQQLLTGRADILVAEYNQRLFRKDQPVRLKKEQAVFETVIKGVTATGELIARDTLERRFGFGEVEWLIGM
jgi:BirA family biotin operon repressor/biotin-[acetyl-CoA-carboxylase] ligase